MSSTKSAKLESASAVSSDRLTSLPLEMKGNILSRLNVQEAVRTSVLSSTWRDTWTNMPEIKISDGSFAQSKFITFVDMALALHKIPLDAFRISGKRSYHDEFDRWMLMLSVKSPRSITIELTSGTKYQIPSKLFYISDLNYLRLKNCIISLPRVFKGFKYITALYLKKFRSTDSDINNLIACSPMLNVISLKSFDGINCLNIQAPELEYLVVKGKFEQFHLDAPNVYCAYVMLLEDHAHQSVPIARHGKNYLKQALRSLTDLEQLAINGSFLTYLSKESIHTKLPTKFDYLEIMSVDICFWDQTELVTACSLLQNAPILKELKLWSCLRSKGFRPMRMSDQDQTSMGELTVQMDHLVTVGMFDFLWSDYEIAFVEKLLTWSPVLEEVKINGKDYKNDTNALKKLLALPRASHKAKVVVT